MRRGIPGIILRGGRTGYKRQFPSIWDCGEGLRSAEDRCRHISGPASSQVYHFIRNETQLCGVHIPAAAQMYNE